MGTEDRAEIASLSTLMLPLLANLTMTNYEEPLGFLANELKHKTITLCLVSNIECDQFVTCQRILKLTKDLQIEVPGDLIEVCSELIETDTELNQGSCLNYELVNPLKCPQCQSSLPFGHCQPECYDCLASLTVCHNTL